SRDGGCCWRPPYAESSGNCESPARSRARTARTAETAARAQRRSSSVGRCRWLVTGKTRSTARLCSYVARTLTTSETSSDVDEARELADAAHLNLHEELRVMTETVQEPSRISGQKLRQAWTRGARKNA